MTLQPGIAYQPGKRPSACYRLLLLDAAEGADRAAVRDGLEAVDDMLRQLRGGEVRELRGRPPDDADAGAKVFEGLEHLFGYGRRLFDPDAHPTRLTDAPRPAHLSRLPPDGPFPSLRWEGGPGHVNRGEADIALQLTAERQAGVNCAAVEVWKLLHDEHIPLRPVASFEGFSRADGRGWLEFHDGVSNILSSQRQAALEAPADPPWIEGGTYMAFLRIVVDLATWRTLSRARQELVVGRDKLTGAALVGTRREASGEVVPIAAEHVEGAPDPRQKSEFIDPPQTTDAVVEASHVHRANQLRGSPSAAAALRIFRQGYEFLDDIDGDPRLGLNFVSFQRDLGILQHLLHLPGWLGDVNFGGSSDGSGEATTILRVAAGGFYAVPPVEQPFPGASLFGPSAPTGVPASPELRTAGRPT